jgi:hypothetical protein
MDVIWAHTSLSFRDMFRGLGVLLLCSTICSLIIWPDAPYEVVDTNANGQLASKCSCSKEEEEKLVAADKRLSLSSSVTKVDLHHQSFEEQISSGVYIRLSVFFLVTSFWANFYIATVTTEVSLLL